MITASLPLILALIGALVYGFAPPKLAELGRLTFLAGLVAFAMGVASSCKGLHL
jgi:hypothetical protein